MVRQHGLIMLELAVAGLLAGLLALWAGHAMVNRMHDAQAQAVAAWMGVLHQGAQDYVGRHALLMRDGAPANALQGDGYADWRRPGIAALRANGHLPAGFPDTIRPVGSAVIRILREGDCPSSPCRLLPVVHASQPFRTAHGAVDTAMLAEWLLATRGLGAAVQPVDPGHVQGAISRYPNPLSAGDSLLPPGTVVLGLAGDAVDFLRVGDTRDPRFQSGASIAGDVHAGGSLHAADQLVLGQEKTWWTLCPDEGAVTRDVRGGLLSCHQGYWVPAARSSGGYSFNTIHGCFTPEGRSSANPATGRCNCPAGASAVPLAEGGDDTSWRGLTRSYLCVY
ncbi:MAG: hypothetical protein WCY98_05220 [Castellaniella sp.]